MQRTNLHSSSIASLPREQRAELISQLTDDEAATLLYDWSFWARDKQQLPPGDWHTWVILAGRGFGKTRTGAEAVRYKVEHEGYRRVALVGRTAADVRDVMVQGESGLLACSPPWFMPKYQPSLRRLTWPNGAIATTYSGDRPDQLRGPQHDLAWPDELAAWRYSDAWDQLMFGLRLGTRPQCIVTTTPRPTPLVKKLLKRKNAVITRGSTLENRANLAPTFIDEILDTYGGTRLGRQEIYAEILDDNPGALWNRDQIDRLRVAQAPELTRVVVAIDPAVTSNANSDETGIVVAGLGANGHGYVLGDGSLRASANQWAGRAIQLYAEYDADRIIGEANNGGDLIETVLRTQDASVSYKKVHASKGKYTRAEPVSALYEKGKVHHVGAFAELEDQMCDWAPDQGMDSPDRMDALVWALSELMLNKKRRLTAR